MAKQLDIVGFVRKGLRPGVTEVDVTRFVKLKRCPFCGSKAKATGDGLWFRIRCGGSMSVHPKQTRNVRECNIQPRTMGSITLDDIVKDWNRRARA